MPDEAVELISEEQQDWHLRNTIRMLGNLFWARPSLSRKDAHLFNLEEQIRGLTICGAYRATRALAQSGR
ncbi:MAG: hypothetical protein R2851_25110 [Caldilineaceae bacterium]